MSKEFLKRILSSLVLMSIVIISITQGGIIFNLFVFLCFILTILNGTTWQKNTIFIYLEFFFYHNYTCKIFYIGINIIHKINQKI